MHRKWRRNKTKDGWMPNMPFSGHTKWFWKRNSWMHLFYILAWITPSLYFAIAIFNSFLGFLLCSIFHFVEFLTQAICQYELLLTSAVIPEGAQRFSEKMFRFCLCVLILESFNVLKQRKVTKNIPNDCRYLIFLHEF